MLKLLIGIATFYLSMTTVLFFKQRSILYQPSQHGLTSTQALLFSLRKWPNDAEYRGYIIEPPNSELTIVIFHGNAGEAADRLYYPKALAATNARVILAEYPGYGNRPGVPSENVFVGDAQTTLSLVSKAYPDEPLVVIGESMGTGVVAAAVATPSNHTDFDSSNIQGLILITPWDSLANLAQTHYWYLPARWLVLDRYDSVRNLQSFTAPVAVVIAGQDQIIPAKHANTLFNAIPSVKARFMLESARHNNWVKYVDDSWWEELLSFAATQAAAPTNDVQ